MTEATLQAIIDHFEMVGMEGDIGSMYHSPSAEFGMEEEGVIHIAWDKCSKLSV